MEASAKPGVLAIWYVKRLRALARGPRTYRRFDTVNAPLERWGLIARTARDVGPSRREYVITDLGRKVCPTDDGIP